MVLPVYNTSTINIVKRVDESQNPVVMIAVTASIISVIVIGGIVGFFMYRRYTSSLIAQKSHQASKKVDQTSRADMTPASPEIIGDEIFEDQYQYQPHGVIDIFGRGNDIIKKGNDADAFEEAIKEDFDEDLDSSDRGKE